MRHSTVQDAIQTDDFRNIERGERGWGERKRRRETEEREERVEDSKILEKHEDFAEKVGEWNGREESAGPKEGGGMRCPMMWQLHTRRRT